MASETRNQHRAQFSFQKPGCSISPTNPSPFQIDVRSENAAKFRQLFDQGKVPEGGAAAADKTVKEKNAELEQMRKTKREQKEYFQKMEKGELDDGKDKDKEPKLLVGKFKDVSIMKDAVNSPSSDAINVYLFSNF